MQIRELSIRDNRVQDFLWQYLEPQDFRHDYTKIDALKYVETQIYNGDCQLFGDIDAGFVFRCTRRNASVLEPHIMGDGRKLREAFRSGLPIVWMMGYEKCVIWTHHERIARICIRFGFTLHARVPKIHQADGQLCDLFALVLEKPECATSTKSETATTVSTPSAPTLLGG